MAPPALGASAARLTDLIHGLPVAVPDSGVVANVELRAEVGVVAEREPVEGHVAAPHHVGVRPDDLRKVPCLIVEGIGAAKMSIL